jgi:predicted dehydrogenase
VVGIADMIVDRARARAEKYGIEAMTVEDLLRRSDVELVVNLTIPVAHYPVAKQVLEAGKSVYNEKPLTETREQSRTSWPWRRNGGSSLAAPRTPSSVVGCKRRAN